MKRSLSIILTCLAVTFSAQGACLYKEQIAFEKTPLVLETCLRIEPKLVSNNGHWQWWEGGFTRQVQLRVGYLTTITNYCTHKIVLRRSTFSTEFAEANFPIINLNLDPHEHSYEDVPLTAQEVKTQMNRLSKECQKYTLESAQSEFGQ